MNKEQFLEIIGNSAEITKRAELIMKNYSAKSNNFSKYTELIGTEQFNQFLFQQNEIEVQMCIEIADNIEKNSFNDISLLDAVIMHAYFYTKSYEKEFSFYQKKFIDLVECSNDMEKLEIMVKTQIDIAHNAKIIYQKNSDKWASEYGHPQKKFTVDQLTVYFYFVILSNLMKMRINGDTSNYLTPIVLHNS